MQKKEMISGVQLFIASAFCGSKNYSVSTPLSESG